MKRTILLLAGIIILIVLIEIKANETGTLPGGQRIYSSLPAKSQLEMAKLGLDYKKLDLVKIFQYLPFDEKIVYLIAFTKSGNFELARVNLPDQKKEIISSIREDLSESSPNFKIVVMRKLEANPFLFYEYSTRINKKIEVFSGDDKFNFKSINKENAPLKSKIFISDANTDGYPDILIWAKVPSKEKDVKNTGEMSVMFFDPQVKKFQSPVLMRDIKGLTSGI